MLSMLIWPRPLQQKHAICAINKSGFNNHADPLFKQSGILILKDMYEYQTTLFMLDVITQRLPVIFNSTLQFNHRIQNILARPIYFIIHLPSPSLLANSQYIHIHIYRTNGSIVIQNNSSGDQTKHLMEICFLSA